MKKSVTLVQNPTLKTPELGLLSDPTELYPVNFKENTKSCAGLIFSTIKSLDPNGLWTRTIDQLMLIRKFTVYLKMLKDWLVPKLKNERCFIRMWFQQAQAPSNTGKSVMDYYFPPIFHMGKENI